jgi:hypothetical protein
MKTRMQDIIRATLAEASKSVVESGKPEAQDEVETEVEVEDEPEVEAEVEDSSEVDTEDEAAPEEDEQVVDEETMSASSLHPAARAISDPKALTSSKVSMMQGMLGLMGSMSKSDMTDWFTKTMAQFGKWGDGAPNDSDKNKSSINAKPSAAVSSSGPKVKMPMPKLDCKEDVAALFDGETLTEEFKDKVTTLFEAAVAARATVFEAELEEAYEAVLAEEVAEFVEETTSKIDAYMDYVVENWMSENEVEIKSTLRSDITEEFIESLKKVFVEHYVDVPEEKVDLLRAFEEEVDELQGRVDSLIVENAELKNVAVDSQIVEIVDTVTEGMTQVDREKFETFAEGVEFTGNAEAYSKKLLLIKENFFGKKRASARSLTEETFEEESDTEVKSTDLDVSRYVTAIRRTVKK